MERAATVLLALEDAAGPIGLTQLAARCGMQPSKVHRYLVSLCRVGMVTQVPSSGLYDLGPTTRRLGAESLRRMDEVGIASEHLAGLRNQTGHAVNLAVWGDNGPIVIRWEYGSYALPITVRIGATLPLLTSSVGRVFLSLLPDSLTRPIIRRQAAADHTTMTPAEVEQLKAEVRRTGYAITSNAVIPGIYSVAAAVPVPGEMLPLAVAVALPQSAATPRMLESVSAALLQATHQMSQDLGGHADGNHASRSGGPMTTRQQR